MMLEFDMNSQNFKTGHLPKYLEETIDKSILQDFYKIRPLVDKDMNNEMFKAIMFTFQAAHISVKYTRVVYSDKTPVVPRKQFLIGYEPGNSGLCLFSSNSAHKEMLCDSPIRELATSCFLTQSLQYVLLEWDKFNVWSFIPVCCSDEVCPSKSRPVNMRTKLFETEEL